MRARVSLVSAALLSMVAVAPAAPSEPFQARIELISAAQRAKMVGVSWKEGCPVGPDDLAAIYMNYIGFDNEVHDDGVLVVHRRAAKEIAAAFGELFAAGFQIERMRPYEDFAVAQYAANNSTVGFYCRPAQDDPGEFSWHAYGLAVDLNPKTNPFLDPKEGWWPKSADGNRDRTAPGLVTAGSNVIKIFMGHGWAWGGIEKNPDFQHFAKVTVGNESNPLNRPVWASQLVDAPK